MRRMRPLSACGAATGGMAPLTRSTPISAASGTIDKSRIVGTPAKRPRSYWQIVLPSLKAWSDVSTWVPLCANMPSVVKRRFHCASGIDSGLTSDTVKAGNQLASYLGIPTWKGIERSTISKRPCAVIGLGSIERIFAAAISRDLLVRIAAKTGRCIQERLHLCLCLTPLVVGHRALDVPASRVKMELVTVHR